MQGLLLQGCVLWWFGLQRLSLAFLCLGVFIMSACGRALCPLAVVRGLASGIVGGLS